MKAKSIIIYCIICLASGIVTGFLAGRRTVEQTVKYVAEKPFAGKVENIEPVKVEVPVSPVLPTRTDTVYLDNIVYTREVVDTAAIIADYELKRSYSKQLFDNQYGKLSLSLSTQYNRLGDLAYEFTPITQIVYRERTWRPFATASFSSLGYIGIGGGLYYKNIGVSVRYVTDFKKNGVDIGVYKVF
jgi:hypothetical protein